MRASPYSDASISLSIDSSCSRAISMALVSDMGGSGSRVATGLFSVLSLLHDVVIMATMSRDTVRNMASFVECACIYMGRLCEV